MGDLGSIPGLGRSPGEGNGYPLQYSGLENSIDCVVLHTVNVQHFPIVKTMLKLVYSKMTTWSSFTGDCKLPAGNHLTVFVTLVQYLTEKLIKPCWINESSLRIC